MVGRLRDVTVHLGPPHPVVDHLLVHHGRSAFLLAWPSGAVLTRRRLWLPSDPRPMAVAVDLADPALDEDELLLGRDVMDTQVVDLAGHRLSRVSDLLLARRADGRLEVAAADVGTAGLVRRLGLGPLIGRISPTAVDWADLHLTSSRGHTVQLSTGTAGFRRLDDRGLAELLTRLSTEHASDVVRQVAPEHAAAALDKTHPHVGRRLLHAMGATDAQRLQTAAKPKQAARLAALRRPQPPLHRRRLLRTAGWRSHRPSGS